MTTQQSLSDPAQAGGPAEFAQGALDVWRAWVLLARNPRLWPWALIPFLLNALLFGVVIYFGYEFASDLLREKFFVDAAWYFKLLGWLIGIVLGIFGMAFIVFLFVPLASIVAEPFNDLLSEKVEILVSGFSAAEPFSLRSFTRSLSLGLWSTIRLALKTTLLVVVILPLHLVPLIGSLIYTVLSAAIVIRYLSLQYTSYCMDRRYWTYAMRQVFLRRHRARTLGFGAMAFATLAIPLVNLMFIPVSAIAGTLLFCAVEGAPQGVDERP